MADQTGPIYLMKSLFPTQSEFMYTVTDRDLNDLESQGCCAELKWDGLFSTVATYMKSKMPQDLHDLIKALGHYRSGPEGSHRYMCIHLKSNHYLYLNHASTVTVYVYLQCI